MQSCARCGRGFEGGEDGSILCSECSAPQFETSVPPPTAPRRQPVPPGYYLISPTAWLIAINFIVFFITAALSHEFKDIDVDSLVRFGANYGSKTLGGEPWRLLTSVFLHGGILHIALNMWALLILGFLAEILFGRRSFVLLYLWCGLAGSLLSVWWHFQTGHAGIVAVGASGAIFGVAGALLPAVALQKNARLRQALRGNLVGIGIFVLYNIAYGFRDAHIDNAAHLGGLGMGLVLGVALPSAPGMNEARHWMRRIVVLAVTGALMGGAFAWVQHREMGVLEYALAQKAFQARDLDNAVQHLRRSIDIDPNIVESRYMLGLIYLQQEKNEEAKTQLLEATKVAPDWSDAHSELCIAYLRLRDLNDALASCKRSVELDPKDPDKQFNLGLTQRAAGDLTGAIASFSAAQSARPGGFDEESLLGETLAEAGRTDEAIQHLQAALKANPESKRTRLLLARLLMSSGHADEARQVLAGR